MNFNDKQYGLTPKPKNENYTTIVKNRATTMITFENKKCKMISHPSEKIYKNESLES